MVLAGGREGMKDDALPSSKHRKGQRNQRERGMKDDESSGSRPEVPNDGG
jgi:hypothetical protein